MRRTLLAIALVSLCCAPPAQAQTRARACPMIAKQCADGSYVSPRGPNCEFPECPTKDSKPQTPQPAPDESFPDDDEDFVPNATPGHQNESGATVLPDQPLTAMVSEPVSVPFIVEHRSALNGKKLHVHGVIVATLTGEKACAKGPGKCAQPRITLAESADEARNKAYDLAVFLPEGDKTAYATGQSLDLSGTIYGATEGVSMTRD